MVEWKESGINSIPLGLASYSCLWKRVLNAMMRFEPHNKARSTQKLGLHISAGFVRASLSASAGSTNVSIKLPKINLRSEIQIFRTTYFSVTRITDRRNVILMYKHW